MKCSLGISNFLEEISSLSHSVVFLYFFALITEEGFLISSCYSLELCILWNSVRRVVAKRSYPKSEVRGSDQECQAAMDRNGRELPRIWGQGQWPGGATPCPQAQARGGGQEDQPHAQGKSHGYVGTGRPRGAIPLWRSGMEAVRRYPSSKVRSNGCALLEQPWRDTPCPR